MSSSWKESAESSEEGWTVTATNTGEKDKDVPGPPSMTTTMSNNGGDGERGSDVPGGGEKLIAAKSLKRRIEVDKTENGSDDDEDGNEDFRSRCGAGKIISTNFNGAAGEEDKDKVSHKKHVKLEQEYYREFFKILKVYLKSAFTIIVKNRKLCPTDGFQTVRVLGTKVPRFLHPSSLEYVEEVAKKMILFLNRNVTEGCAMHIMIEKNKTLHVVQRFIFQFHGSLDIEEVHDDEVMNVFDLEEVKNQLKMSLLEILNCTSIKPMTAPQYSRWSLSIGIKEELAGADEEAFNQLWNYDPSAGYFPWKKRPKSLASSGRRVSCKLDFAKMTAKASNHEATNEKNQLCDNDAHEQYSGQKSKISKGAEAQGHESSTVTQMVSPTPMITDSCNESSKTLKSTFTFSSGDTRGNCKVSSVQVSTEDIDGILCFPVSSFQVMSGLMLTIYGLEYPAPREKANTDPSPGIRNARSPSIMHRMSHFRNRILRQS